MKKWITYITTVGLSIPFHLFAQEPINSNDSGLLNLSKKEIVQTTISKPGVNHSQRVRINEALPPALTKSEKEKIKTVNQPLTPVRSSRVFMNLSAKEKRALGL